MAIVAIHGGAGTIAKAAMTAAEEAAYLQALSDILEAARRVLDAGGTALDAVSRAVELLENEALFNAGHGAVFTRDGTHELDASIMDGASLASGAVACVSRIKNPVLAARAVMEKSPHVFFTAAGAEAFAQAQGLAMVDPGYFSTPRRLAQLMRVRDGDPGQVVLDHDGSPLDESRKMGTVGAVALDRYGNLAAATSTGGMTNKAPGRVGDSPLIGAGCYADNRTCAVSCTGTGEIFIRVASAHDVSARMAYGGQSLADACHSVIFDAVGALGGEGGLIAVDRHGHVSLTFNSEGMYRGYARSGEAPRVGIDGGALVSVRAVPGDRA